MRPCPPTVGDAVRLALPKLDGSGTTRCFPAVVESVNAYPEDVVVHLRAAGHFWQHVMLRREFGLWGDATVATHMPGCWHFPDDPGIHDLVEQ